MHHVSVLYPVVAALTFIDVLSVHAALAIESARLHERERQQVRIERG